MVYPAKLSLSGILQAAEQILDEQGVAALGMRSVAERLGVRPTSLYKHVGDLAGLQQRLAERSAAQLTSRIIAALSESKDNALQKNSVSAEHATSAAAALSVAAHEYLGYASEHSARYQLLTTEFIEAEQALATHVARKELWNLLLSIVGQLTDDSDDTSAAVATWAFLHGFSALQQAGLFGASGPRDGLQRGVLALVRGLPKRRG